MENPNKNINVEIRNITRYLDALQEHFIYFSAKC